MILDSGEFTAALRSAFDGLERECLLASAYVKKNALDELTRGLRASFDSVSVVARWQKGDLVVGASDLEVYQLCRDRGWSFGVDLNFHGKLYMFDRSKIFVGSANLTSSGLSFFSHGNKEFGTILPAERADLEKLDRFIHEDVLWINDELFSLFCQEMLEGDDPDNLAFSWSPTINALFSPDLRFLWTADLFFCTPEMLLESGLQGELITHDLGILSLGEGELSLRDLQVAFRGTKVFSWMLSLLRRHGSINFGGISANLHHSLLDDPAPYRKTVKDFVSVLFSWLHIMNEDFIVRKHRRTSSVSLVNPSF